MPAFLGIKVNLNVNIHLIRRALLERDCEHFISYKMTPADSCGGHIKS